MVTLSQPATHPFRRGYAHPCQAVASAELIPVVYSKSLVWLTLLTGLDGLLLASNEALLTVELPQAVRPDRSTHRFTIQANAEVAAPESRGQR